MRDYYVFKHVGLFFVKDIAFIAGSVWAMVAAIMMIVNGSAAEGWGLISMISLLLIGWETFKHWWQCALTDWHDVHMSLMYKPEEDEELDYEIPEAE